MNPETFTNQSDCQAYVVCEAFCQRFGHVAIFS